MIASDVFAPTITLRAPSKRDGAAMWELARSSALELNTCYAYLLLASHFSGTCVLAECNGQLLGFVAAYRPPTKPDVVFVWQIGVSEAARARGLGKRLLRELLRMPACEGVKYLEATVAPSNAPSTRLFVGLAREHGVACERSRGFEPSDFANSDHESEELFRIGPLERNP